MNIDFNAANSMYLVAKPGGTDGAWGYTPFNVKAPRTGGYLSSHQAFGNAGLFFGIHLYNPVNGNKVDKVGHSLQLCFSNKVDGSYLLGNDEQKEVFNLDIGAAARLYSFLTNKSSSLVLVFSRPGMAVRRLTGERLDTSSDGGLTLIAVSGRGGEYNKISMSLSRSDQVNLALHCLGYVRLLYPSLSDTAIGEVLIACGDDFRACAENAPDDHSAMPAETTRTADAHRKPVNPNVSKALWAIGNKKWPRRDLAALKKMQETLTPDELQALVDAGNAGDFTAWDSTADRL